MSIIMSIIIIISSAIKNKWSYSTFKSACSLHAPVLLCKTVLSGDQELIILQ